MSEITDALVKTIKGRIKNVLNYKKPALWFLVVAVIIIIVIIAAR